MKCPARSKRRLVMESFRVACRVSSWPQVDSLLRQIVRLPRSDSDIAGSKDERCCMLLMDCGGGVPAGSRDKRLQRRNRYKHATHFRKTSGANRFKRTAWAKRPYGRGCTENGPQTPLAISRSCGQCLVAERMTPSHDCGWSHWSAGHSREQPHRQ